MTFTVEADASRNRLIITLSGFASIKDVRHMEKGLGEALNKLPQTGGGHQLLYDVSDAKIQTQEVVSELRELCRRTPRTSAFALVNASALAGRQLERIFAGLEPKVFQSRSLATAWLDAVLAAEIPNFTRPRS